MTTAREATGSTGASVTLTADDRVLVVGDPWGDARDSELAVIWDRLADVARVAESTLDGVERRTVLELVFGGLATALVNGDGGGDPGLAAKRLGAALEAAEARLAAASARRARQRYLEGMLLGLVVVLVVAGLARLGLVYVIRDTVPGTMLFPTVLVAGAFGGFVSVLTRITRGTLDVPIGGRDGEIRLLGAFRPVVGVVFGTALAVVLLSDALPVRLPAGDLRPFWVVGLAFLAGFGERLAQEVPPARRASRGSSGTAAPEAPGG